MSKLPTLRRMALLSLIATFFIVAPCTAADTYMGDTVIYGGEVTSLKPNVLIILDSSGSMDWNINGSVYNPATSYSETSSCEGQLCEQSAVYEAKTKLIAGEKINYWSKLGPNIDAVTTECAGRNVKELLQGEAGQWTSTSYGLDSDGNCVPGRGTYQLGNYINWANMPVGTVKAPKILIARQVLLNLINSVDGVNFGVMRFSGRSGGEVLKETVYSQEYEATVKDMDEIFKDGYTNRDALAAIIDRIDKKWSSGLTPLAETMVEAVQYYQGKASSFGNGTYTSPISDYCQKSFIIVISDGAPTSDGDDIPSNWFADKGTADGGTCDANGDCDGDGNEPDRITYGSDYLDDIAYYLAHTDQSDLDGDQFIQTYTVGFNLNEASAAYKLLVNTAENGNGEAYSAQSPAELATALTNIIISISQVDSSFVAPVVPASPTNRSFSGNSLYLGLFKPQSNGPWRGNLKKYQLGADLAILDKDGAAATNSDGQFLADSTSFWSSAKDGGKVEEGGAGARLAANASRSIYSNVASCDDSLLACSANSVVKSNTNLTNALFGVTEDLTREALIDYLHGKDVFDENGNENITENRPWVMGSVLHAEPAVVGYDNSTTVVFVPSNDGMLHAIDDETGNALWSFIPKTLLKNVQQYTDGEVNYGLDSSPLVIIRDLNKDGISAEDNDLVMLVFGLRRGGTHYYALDVTDPQKPRFMWTIGSENSDFSELGQTWSKPALATVLDENSKPTLALIFGAGYDNLNEDERYGKTQLFTDEALPVGSRTADSGNVTSDGTVKAAELSSPMGRGIFAVKIATTDLSQTNPYAFLYTTPSVSWTQTYSSDPDSRKNLVRYSVPGEVTAIDTNFDGYTDRLYWADTGGQVWRTSSLTSSGEPDNSPNIGQWKSERIFTAGTNPVDDNDFAQSQGRKFFFRPAVVAERFGLFSLYLVSGDRAHPLNTAVDDRIYSVIDRGQKTSDLIGESRLVDVTSNELQLATTSQTAIKNVLKSLSLYQTKDGNEKYGWYLSLNARPGEKGVSAATVFNKVAYFSTFTAETTTTSDRCISGNLGEGRLYAVDYRTGEAVFNYFAGNDSQSTDNNQRAKGSAGEVLRKEDRQILLGGGMPSKVTIVLSKDGQKKGLIAGGDDKAVKSVQVSSGGTTQNMYWMQR